MTIDALWGDIMEDHSIRGYLKRRSIDELESLLSFCLQEENFANYRYAIGEILDVLKDRVTPEYYLNLTRRLEDNIIE